MTAHQQAASRRTQPAPPKGHQKVEKVMHEFKEGTLKSSSGEKVTDRNQAVAIGLSEQRRAEHKPQRKAKK
ncbi:MAG: hypothetical protein IPM15_09785 [Betaproteobacteria bacterium]|nr:hypothetical protein [Betaproteobacteria bacterium]